MLHTPTRPNTRISRDPWVSPYAPGAAYRPADPVPHALIVPAGINWKVLSAFIELVSTPAIGSRRLELSIADSLGNVLHAVEFGVDQPASTTRRYLAFPGAATETSFDRELIPTIRKPCPDTWLGPGCQLRVRDRAGIDIAADDITVRFLVDSRAANLLLK